MMTLDFEYPGKLFAKSCTVSIS